MNAKLSKFFVCVACIALSVVSCALPANARNSVISPSDESQVRLILTKFLVPISQQDALIVKVNNGETWDVYNDSGPTVTEQRMIGDMDYTITRYEDGSVKASGIQRPQLASGPKGMVSPDSINSCRYSSGSGYSNATGCTVDGLWGSAYLAAKNVSYTLVQGGPDQITSMGYGVQNCSLVTCTSPVLVSSRSTESGSTPASARWQSDVTNSVVVPKSWNIWFQLNVGGDSAWQTNS